MKKMMTIMLAMLMASAAFATEVRYLGKDVGGEQGDYYYIEGTEDLVPEGAWVYGDCSRADVMLNGFPSDIKGEASMPTDGPIVDAFNTIGDGTLYSVSLDGLLYLYKGFKVKGKLYVVGVVLDLKSLMNAD